MAHFLRIYHTYLYLLLWSAFALASVSASTLSSDEKRNKQYAYEDEQFREKITKGTMAIHELTSYLNKDLPIIRRGLEGGGFDEKAYRSLLPRFWGHVLYFFLMQNAAFIPYIIDLLPSLRLVLGSKLASIYDHTPKYVRRSAIMALFVSRILPQTSEFLENSLKWFNKGLLGWVIYLIIVWRINTLLQQRCIKPSYLHLVLSASAQTNKAYQKRLCLEILKIMEAKGVQPVKKVLIVENAMDMLVPPGYVEISGKTLNDVCEEQLMENKKQMEAEQSKEKKNELSRVIFFRRAYFKLLNYSSFHMKYMDPLSLAYEADLNDTSLEDKRNVVARIKKLLPEQSIKKDMRYSLEDWRYAMIKKNFRVALQPDFRTLQELLSESGKLLYTVLFAELPIAMFQRGEERLPSTFAPKEGM